MSTIKQCDKCKSIKDVESLYFEVGSRTDAAGSRESVGEGIDLCLACQSKLLKALCKNRPSFSNTALEIIQGWNGK